MINIDQDTRDVIQENLTKRDLLDIIEELSIGDIELTTRYSAIIDAILKDCDDNGVPEWEDCSKLLRRFLMTAEITDKDGELITEKSSEKVDETSVTQDIETYPECFGLADRKDPACNRCKVLEICLVKHKESLPPCYGKEYSDKAEECAICIENTVCKGLTNDTNNKN
jgi:hypothetical protein